MPKISKTRQEYRTAKQEARQQTLRTVLSFTAFVLLVAGFSALYYWRNAEPKLPEDDPNTSGSTTAAPSPDSLGSAVFFVYLQSEKNNAPAAALVRADADALTADVRILSRKQINTLAKDGGLASPAQCAASLRDRLKVTADRCVIVSEKGLKDIVNTLGGLEIHMDAQLDFVLNGSRNTLFKGINRLSGEKLLRYLQWSAQEGDAEAQGALLCGLLALGLSERSHAKGERLFTELINSVQSDITALDYMKAQAALEVLAVGEIEIKTVK